MEGRLLSDQLCDHVIFFSSTAGLFGFCAFPGLEWAEQKARGVWMRFHSRVLVVMAGQAVWDSTPERDAAQRSCNYKDLLVDSLGNSDC